MDSSSLEARIRNIADFFRRYSIGIVDDRKPEVLQCYSSQMDIAGVLGLFASEVNAASKGFKFPSFPEWLDGKMSAFIRQFREIWVGPKNTSYLGLASVKPSLIVDIGTGNGKTTFEYMRALSAFWKGFSLTCIDQDAEALRTASHRKKRATFCAGELTSDGTIGNRSTIYAGGGMYGYLSDVPSVFTSSDTKALTALNLCGVNSDFAAAYGITNGFDFIAIARCCYDQLNGTCHTSPREWYTPVGRQITYNLLRGLDSEFKGNYLSMDVINAKDLTTAEASRGRKVCSEGSEAVSVILNGRVKGVLSVGCFEYNHITTYSPVRAANLIFADLFRLAVSLDLAARIADAGYDADVERFEGRYLVHATKLR